MSESKYIRLGGVSNEPNDYEHEEGDLSVAINAVKHNGSIRAVQEGKYVKTFPKGYELKYIHEYNSYCNYIYTVLNIDTTTGSNTTTIKYKPDTDDVDMQDLVTLSEGEEVRQIKAVRMVLVVSTSEGIKYARFDGQTYKWLGAMPSMPFAYPYITTGIVRNTDYPDLVAALTTSFTGKEYKSLCESIDGNIEYAFSAYTDSDGFNLREDIYNKFFSVVNSLRTEIRRDGQFSFPFYVRLAYRMYDGSYVSVTRPFLMCPMYPAAPFAFSRYIQAGDTNGTFDVCVAMAASTLSVYVESIDSDWKDIITGIDVFVSTEMVDYTDSAESIVSAIPFAKDESIDDIICQSTKSNDGEYKDIYKDTFIFNPSPVSPDDSIMICDRVGNVFFYPNRTTSLAKSLRREDNYVCTYYFAIPKSAGETTLYLDSQIVYPSTSTDGIRAYLTEEVFDQYTWYYLNYSGNYILKGITSKTKALKFRVVYTKSNGEQQVSDNIFKLNLSRTDGSSCKNEVDSNGNFYKVGSLDFDDYEDGGIYTPEFNEHDIETLVTKPRLEDDAVRTTKLTAKDIMPYNNRLNIIVDEQGLEEPGSLESYCNVYKDDTTSSSTQNSISDIYFKIIKDGATYMTKTSHITDDSSIPMGSIRYLFYPNINAKTAVLKVGQDESINTGTIFGIFEYNDKTYRWFLFEGNDALKINVIKHFEVEVPLISSNGVVGSYWFNEMQANTSYSSANSVQIHYFIPRRIDILHNGKPIPTIMVLDENSTEQKLIIDPGMQDALTTSIKTQVKYVQEQKVNAWLTEQGISATYEETKYGGDNILIEGTEIYNFDYPDSWKVGNKLLYTDALNPFAFRNAYSHQFSAGEVYCMASSARPISQGQFGEYNLYAFADNGVYAMSVQSDGTYGSESIVSADVCINKNSVTNLEQSVLFVTERGLMEISGGQISCISEVLDGHNYTNGLSKLTEVIELSGTNITEIPTHISEYLADAYIVYAYKSQKLFIFREDSNTGYVYSLNSKTWGMFHNPYLYAYSTYDKAYAIRRIRKGNDVAYNIIDLANIEINETAEVNSLIVTRPIEFGYPDIYKTVETALVRGIFDSDDLSGLIVWASNNGKDYYIIGTAAGARWRNYSGTPYKYYRFGLIMNWNEQDSINGISVEVTPRLTDKIR